MTPESFLAFADPLPEPMLLLAGSGTILAGNRAVETRLHIPLYEVRGKNLADVVAESPEEVVNYLRACSRSRSLVLGALVLLAEGQEVACRTEGTLISPRTKGSEAVLFVRLIPKESAVGQFIALNHQIEDLRRENHRRQNAEIAARQQAERLRVTLHSIGDGVIVTDAEGQVQILNPVAQAMVGWTLEEAIGTPLPDVFHIVNEDTRAPVENPALRALREGNIVGLANHTILISRDGIERPIDDSAAPIRDDAGTIIGSVLVFRDITERKWNEHQLHQHQEWLRVTLASIGDAVIATDTRGRLTFINEVGEGLTGWKQDDAQGQPLEVIFPIINEQTRKPVENPVEKVLREGVIVGLANHTLLIAKDGTERPIDDSAAPIRDASGKLLGVVLIFRDVTEQRRAEQELRASEARKSAVLRTALDCIITMNHEGQVVEFNPAAERTFGYRREEIIGQELCEYIIPTSLRELHRQGLSNYLATGEGPVLGRRLELSALRSDGSKFPVEVAITRNSEENPPLFTAYLRDISEAKRIERHRSVRLAVTQALSEATTVSDGASRVLEAICQGLDWDIGFLWRVTDSGNGLNCAKSWHKPEVLAMEFEQNSFGRLFAKGEGLPGRIWSTGRAEWILDVLTCPQFPRAMSAAKYDLHSAFGCPIVVGNRTLGVIEFFTRHISEPDAELLELMGTIAGTIGQFLERKEAEDELRRSEQELSDFFENAVVGLHWVGSDGVILRANKAELDLLGYTAEEYIGRPIANFHADKDVICDILSRLKAGEQIHEYPARLRCKDGSIKDVLIDSSALFRGSEFVHTRCFTTDVTERKRSEAALREAQRRFEAVFNQQFQFMAILAPDGTVLEANETWFNTTGVQREQVLGRLFWESPWWNHSPVVREKWKMLISQAQQGTGPATSEVGYQTADGVTRHATAVVTGLKDDSGRVTSIVVEGHDDTERKQQEAALRESEEKLRLLANTIPQLAWMAKPDGDIFWYNHRWYEYTGTTPEQMEGWGWQAVHDPDVLPKVIERWKDSLTTGEPFDMVFPLKAADGQYHPFLTRVNPLRDSTGCILYWFGTNTDITELRQTREALATSEERLRLALDAGRMGVWDWNVRTGDLKWSDSLEPLHGLAPGTFGGTFDHFQQLIHPDDRETVNASIRQALETGGEFYVEFRNIWQNGGIHWIAGSGKVFPGDDGHPLRMIGIGLDVTQRKRSEQTARFLADASAALAVLVDFDSTLQKVSSLAVPSFADWATVDMAEADGFLRRVSVSHIDPAKVQLAHDVHSRFPPDPAAPQGVWNILRTGRSEIVPEITDELLVQSTKDEELLGILRELGLRSYIGVPLTVRGKVLGVITFINAESGHQYDETDLSVAEDLASRAAIAIENAQLYRELRQADQRKDEFLATLAHELRNPLAPIRNGLQVLRLAGSGGELGNQARSMMERQLNQMVRLVDDLLDVSRITRNKLQLRTERVSLAAVINIAVETSRPLMEQAGHTFSLTLPSAPIYLDADLTRLAQVFSNLLNNAAKYTEPGGHISLTGVLKGAEVIVEVRDNGLGIPADALLRIFELFSQVDSHKERAQGGLGIGLTLVRRLVEMHGGTIAAQSDGPGRGSQFIVQLPIAKATPQESTSQGNDGLSASVKRRILVVDDNCDSAMSLGMMLNLMGNETHLEHDGLAAVEAAEKFRPDMILLDIGLPKLNGYDACRLIRQRPWSRQIVIIALTGWGQEEDRRRSQDAGFDHHLVKPLDISALQMLMRDR